MRRLAPHLPRHYPYAAYLSKIRAADPHALIVALRPFNGTHADDIKAAVAAANDRKIVYVDTTGWLAPDDFNGSTHPNIQGHQVAAAKLTAVLKRLTGWSTGPIGTPKLAPQGLAEATCSDTPLTLTYQGPVRLGVSGKVQIHAANGTVVDTISLADLTSYQRSVGQAQTDFGQLHTWMYQAVVVDGPTVKIYPHRRLEPGQVYSVTVDPGFVVGDRGTNEWRFRTRHDPKTDERLSVGPGKDFCTVQAAVDFVGEGHQTTIDVAPGLYRELVWVPPTKPGLTIRGAGAGKTVIGYPNNNLLNGDSAMGNVPPEQSYCQRRVIPIHAGMLRTATPPILRRSLLARVSPLTSWVAVSSSSPAASARAPLALPVPVSFSSAFCFFLSLTRPP